MTCPSIQTETNMKRVHSKTEFKDRFEEVLFISCDFYNRNQSPDKLDIFVAAFHRSFFPCMTIGRALANFA